MGVLGFLDPESWGKGIKATAEAATGIIAANQARQDAKHAQDLANQAVDTSRGSYAERGGFRNLAGRRLTTPTNYDYSSEFSTTPDVLGTQAETAQGKSLRDLSEGPDYLSLAQQALSDFDTRSQPEIAAAYRKVGQKAAALGRIGSGGVTTELGNVTSDFLRNRELAKNEFVRNAVEANQANKFNVLGAASGIAGQRQGVQQQGVQNRAAKIGAERASRGQDFGEGMSLADLGYSNDPTNALFQGANVYRGSSAQNAQGAGDAFGALGTTLAGLKRAPTQNFMLPGNALASDYVPRGLD